MAFDEETRRPGRGKIGFGTRSPDRADHWSGDRGAPATRAGFSRISLRESPHHRVEKTGLALQYRVEVIISYDGEEAGLLPERQWIRTILREPHRDNYAWFSSVHGSAPMAVSRDAQDAVGLLVCHFKLQRHRQAVGKPERPRWQGLTDPEGVPGKLSGPRTLSHH